MFGVVPKSLWSRQIPADDLNRIPMVARCLMIESLNTDRLYLVDSGCGTKFNEKFADIYGIDQSEYDLLSSLDYHGFAPSEVTDIVFTHLHFDHCGGTTYYSDNGVLKHTFPDARYHVTRSNWETATNPNVREKASFFEENINPLQESGRLHLNGEKHRFEDHFYVWTINGHTRGQQLPVLEAGDGKIIYAGDLIPTSAHLPLPWVMGFDMCARNTLDEKQELLEPAAQQGWHLYMEHDYRNEVIQVGKNEKHFGVKNSYTLAELS
jgi:glyoxylase-like metal-dependent hydrolase (beta-lactamase superfamily II)